MTWIGVSSLDNCSLYGSAMGFPDVIYVCLCSETCCLPLFTFDKGEKTDERKKFVQPRFSEV